MRQLINEPQHPYTWGLLGSMPRLMSDVTEQLTPIPGAPPSLLSPPPGCSFHTRCGFTDLVGGGRCSAERPVLPEGRGSACHLTDEQKRSVFIETIQPRLG